MLGRGFARGCDVLALLLCLSAGSRAAEPAGVVKRTQGETSIHRSGNLITPTPGMKVFSGDGIRTGRDDSLGLAENSMSFITGIVEETGARRAVDVSVVGHTDRVGDEEYNLDLSTRRAGAVRDLLVSRGIDPSILHVASHGEENPLVPTEDEVSEPLNRRVEVTVR